MSNRWTSGPINLIAKLALVILMYVTSLLFKCGTQWRICIDYSYEDQLPLRAAFFCCHIALLPVLGCCHPRCYFRFVMFCPPCPHLKVNKLDAQLTSIQSQEDEAVEKDLLVYIKSMPEHQLQVKRWQLMSLLDNRVVIFRLYFQTIE